MRLSETSHSRAMVGIAARYISVARGGMAVREARKAT
jgi:hypothetical protein